MEFLVFFIWLIQACVFGIACRIIADNRGHYSSGWFWWGFFFGIIALLVALSLPEESYSAVYPTESQSSLTGNEDIWTCTCGRRNYAYSNACHKCGKLKTEVQNERKALTEKERTISSNGMEEAQVIKLLKEYKELLDAGVLTKEEFDKKKVELLASKTKI